MKAKTHKGRTFYSAICNMEQARVLILFFERTAVLQYFESCRKLQTCCIWHELHQLFDYIQATMKKKVSLRRAEDEGQSLLPWQQGTCVFVHAALSIKKSINEDLICQNLKFNALECFLPLLILLQKNESKLQKVENKKAWKLCVWSHLQ